MTRSRPATQQREKEEKPDWRVTYGFWTELDALYHSFPSSLKPRCPALPHDSPPEWKKRMVADDIDQFLGNPTATSCIRELMSNATTEATGAPTNFIISGGDFTGKSTFAGLLRNTLLSINPDHPCRFATLNANEVSDRVLHGRLEDAVKRLDASKTGSASFLTIERFECVPPSMQQHSIAPLLVEANHKNVFMILLVRPDANKLAEPIKILSTKVHLIPLTANLVRRKLLLICQQEQIGYTKDGLEELFKQGSYKLRACMEKLHEIFLKHYYLSRANVQKFEKDRQQPRASGTSVSHPAVTPFPLSIIRMNEPLRRCPKCTLVPPCSHISLEKLHSKIERARAMYPANGMIAAPLAIPVTASGDVSSTLVAEDSSERQLCPSFRRSGICSNIQKLGRCRYAHPLDIHVIDTTSLTPRCHVHTLPLPCMHCSNAELVKMRARKEVAACENLKRELLRSQQVLADLETQRFMFVRNRGKSVKWGGAKKAAEEQLARLDAAIASSKSDSILHEQELHSRQIALEKLQDDATHGRSHGMGKGHGHDDNQRNKLAVVAAV